VDLANQDPLDAIDPRFDAMAEAVGRRAWGLRALTIREKAFVFIAADLCTGNLGLPLATHVAIAVANGVEVRDCAAAIRHLAPFVGYPTAAVALRQLRSAYPDWEPDPPPPPPATPGRHVIPPDVLDRLDALDSGFAMFATEQFDRRWDADDGVSNRERALMCLATDVLHQTLDESFDLHLDLATGEGAGRHEINAVLLLVAEYGVAKAWHAHRALLTRLAG
jgi:alkylhydroperoxidase/carboxymuconolactone decarboxylase family protein YurZ